MKSFFRIVVHAVTACWLLTSAGAIAATATAPRTQPNILLLVAEDMSPHLGSFGDPVAKTPTLDQLAQQGVRYSRVFTTAGVCAPSRAALLTGQHQISFGGQHMRSYNGPDGKYFAQPAAGVRAFPELLRAEGYFTYTDTKLDYQFSGIRAGSGPFTIWDRDGVDYQAWRQRADGQPFFGLINFIVTHESGVMRVDVPPHSPAHARTQQMRKAAGLVAPTVTDLEDVTLPPYYPDLPEVRADVARHYDNIHAMDQEVATILAALAQDGLADNTIVLWTTDHGDGLPRAKRELYDSGIHVPMVLHIPQALRHRNKAWQHLHGQTDNRLVSFVDLAPTILGFAGAAAKDYHHGESILVSKRDFVLASRDRIDSVMDRQRAIRDSRYKYIRSWYPDVPGGHRLAYRDNLDMVRAWRSAYAAGSLDTVRSRWFEPAGEQQLYDLSNDPYELNNLALNADHQEILRRMDQQLMQKLREVGDTGEIPERELRARLLNKGQVPVTPPPAWRIETDQLILSSDIDASIGYRAVGEKYWQLYTGPLAAGRWEAKAVRYGWSESEVVQTGVQRE